MLGQIISWPGTLIIRTQVDINHKVPTANMDNYVLSGVIHFDKGHYKGVFKSGMKWIEANDLKVSETESPLNKLLTPTTYALIYTRHAETRQRETIDVEDEDAGLNQSGTATPTMSTDIGALSLVTVAPTQFPHRRQSTVGRRTPPPNRTIAPTSFPKMSAPTSRETSTTGHQSMQSAQSTQSTQSNPTLSQTGLSHMTLRSHASQKLGSGDAKRRKLLSLHPSNNTINEKATKTSETKKETELHKPKTKEPMNNFHHINEKHETVCENNAFNCLEKSMKCCENNPCSPSIKNKREEMSHIVRDNTAFGVVSRKGCSSDTAEGPGNIQADVKKVETKFDDMSIAMQKCSSAKNGAQCKNGPLTSLSGLDDSLQRKQQKTCETMDMVCATNLSSLHETDGKENTKNKSLQ